MSERRNLVILLPQWQAVVGVARLLALPALVVEWEPAQRVFDTVGLSLADWGIAVAASVLLLEELRKLAVGGMRQSRSYSREAT
jgi:Ca2+-transporting ATPase